MDPDLKTFVEESVQDAVKQSQNVLLSNLDTLMKARFDQFGKQVSESQKEVSDLQIAQLKSTSTDSYKFRKLGNEEQHKHNSKVLEKMREAKFHLDSGSTGSVQLASSKMAEGIDIVLHRQKLVKLADSSELGWKVVSEYETHQLAEDSDDEKRIFKAEARAQRKVTQFRRGRRFQPYQTQRSATTALPSTSLRKPGLCFSCGKPGHWKADCLKLKGDSSMQDAPKISIFKYKSSASEGSALFKDIGSHEAGLSHQEGVSSCVNDYDSFSLSTVKQPTVDLHATSTFLNSKTVTLLDKIQSKVNGTVSPRGRLCINWSFWQKAGASSYILKVIKEGYRLPFLAKPISAFLRNNQSALLNEGFVSEEIQKLLDRDCVSVSVTKPLVINPLTVAFGKSGKMRLVLDCRHINPHLADFKFRLEDCSVARCLFQKGDYLFSFDLKSAYHHIEISPEFKKYLGFAWDNNGKTTFYVFNVLPFGIKTAAHIFTKVARVMTSHWRSAGFKILMYLDDGLAGAKNFEEALVLSKRVQRDLDNFGFVIAQEKCKWEPSLQITWLGLEWNLSSGFFKAQGLLNTLTHLESEVILKGGFAKARALASCLGQIQSMHAAIGSTVRLRTRFLYHCLQYRGSWNSIVPVDQRARGEIIFWKENLRKINGQDLEGSETYTGSVFTDGSQTGYGGYFSEVSDTEVFGLWSGVESDMSSTWRELEALSRTCLVECVKLRASEAGVLQNKSTQLLYGKMANFLLKSRADSTVHKYVCYFDKWKQFVFSIGGEPLPANPIHIALFITHLIDSGTSYHVTSAIKYSIKWTHEMHGYSDPTENSFVNNLVETSKRLHKPAVVKKEPISVDSLITLCKNYDCSSDLAVIRDLAMILICFAGFLRFDELSSLRCCDVSFFDEHLSIAINKSKTDQYRQGNEIVIAKGTSIACPVLMLKRYINIADLNMSSHDYLFRPLFRSGSTCKLIYKNKKLSYTRARECIIGRLREVVGSSNIGLHSLRAGGATAVAADATVNERCWKRHGRWRSESAKDGYVADTLSSRLQVTKSLQL